MILKNWAKTLLGFLGTILILGFTALTTLDRTEVDQTDHYQATFSQLDSISNTGVDTRGDTLRAGWSKVNITPKLSTELAGYGAGKLERVVDSLWVRTFLLTNGNQHIAVIAPDLLIFPPEVKSVLEDRLDDLNLTAIYYGATHTHHSVGAWHPGFVGKMFAGNYDPQVVNWLADKIVLSIQNARENLLVSRIGFAAIEAEHLVYNRLAKELGTIDPWLRFIRIEQDSGENAVLASFSAHATNISRDQLITHRDYPGLLVDQLEQDPKVDFAAFMAGAVGSQGPKGEGVGLEKARFVAHDLAGQIGLISNVMSTAHTTVLGIFHSEITLGEPQFRVAPFLRLRPWLFRLIFGQHTAHISALRISDTIFAGTPCDFSGELIGPIETHLREKELNLMLTSFNGGYVGYITKDEWYDMDAYETMVMNWFGPGNGQYFSEIVTTAVDILADQ